MSFKSTCGDFLAGVKQMRDSAIAQAVQSSLQTEHEPYKAQLVKARDEFVVAEKEACEKLVEQIKAECEKKCQAKFAVTENAIAEHRNSVTATAEATVKAEYDNFILEASALIDKTKIN